MTKNTTKPTVTTISRIVGTHWNSPVNLFAKRIRSGPINAQKNRLIFIALRVDRRSFSATISSTCAT
ncbi:hypothetical protein AB0L41_04045 [Amycolatopsis mediterranei]|uniref:hypothetical protein n=1 Tax=Amycolatopsis mediterranei TaxID=33910 RepID=UPI003423A133